MTIPPIKPWAERSGRSSKKSADDRKLSNLSFVFLNSFCVLHFKSGASVEFRVVQEAHLIGGAKRVDRLRSELPSLAMEEEGNFLLG